MHTFAAYWRWGLVLLVVGLLGACQTVREASSLKDVQFRIARAEDVRLAGIDVADIQAYDDLRRTDVARLVSALSRGELPFSFTLYVEARNPESNSVDARLTEMDWTLLLDEQETVSGTVDQEVVLRPGTPTDVPVDVQLNLVEFFDQNLRQLIGLVAAISGEGPPTNVTLRVQPTIQTALGPMTYPNPITVTSTEVGASDN